MTKPVLNKGLIGKCITFSTLNEKNNFKSTYLSKHDIFDDFKDGKILRYNKDICDFRKVVADILYKEFNFLKKTKNLKENLENLHKYLPKKYQILESASETNEVTRRFYDYDKIINRVYLKFLKTELKKYIDDDFYYQKTATIRFQFPKQKSFNWNPSIHTDIMLGHPVEEINIWLPITNVKKTNSMAIASLNSSIDTIKHYEFDFNLFASDNQNNLKNFKKNFKKLKPLQMQSGSFLIFDPRRLHATQKNKTNHTRISMDIRIIKRKIYNKIKTNYIGTGRRKMKFIPGQYYSKNFI